METPASKRMVTRSRAGAGNPVSSSQESDVNSRQRKSGQALTDITNDSPVVGLTCGSVKTPLTRMVGRSARTKAAVTPGSGEALLRGQVKNLLQMVEEESEVPKLPQCPFVRSFTDSPITLLAPANTPQVPDSGDASGLELPAPIVQEPINISQALSDAFEARGGGPLTRSLMLEFLEKDVSDVSECRSTVSVGERNSFADDDDDDGSSIWSMQVNGCSVDDEDVCRGMSGLSLDGGIGRLPLFSGKHIIFVYNSDDEDEVVAVEEAHH
uniref:Uncharacterized protein n=1 Tax=Kalanchoe fedtschenkoi TaxID=63787 RepID=A0A7N0TVY4_KALFE